MDIITMVGVLGSGSILVAFFLNQIGRWDKDALVYDVVNALGSLLLIGYALLIDSYPFLVLNAVWFLVSAKDVLYRK